MCKFSHVKQSLWGSYTDLSCSCYWQVFPSLPWNGHLSSKLRTKPTEDVQSDCYYPSCDTATPPYVPALEGILSQHTYIRQLPNDDVMVWCNDEVTPYSRMPAGVEWEVAWGGDCHWQGEDGVLCPHGQGPQGEERNGGFTDWRLSGHTQGEY